MHKAPIEKQQFESSNKGVEIRQKGFLQPTYIRRTSGIVIGPDFYNVIYIWKINSNIKSSN